MGRTNNGGGRAPFSSATATKKAKPTRANRSSKSDPANAYTYEPALPKRHRTSEQQNSLTYEETKAGPSSPRRKSKAIQEDEEEDDEEKEMEERIRKLQMMIASDAPGEIDEDSEESEVDSDEAWGSEGSDEERWGDVFRDLQKGKSKAKAKKGKEVVLKPATLMTVDLDETDDEAPVKKGKSKAVAADEEDEESEDEFAADRDEAGSEEEEEEDDEDEDEDDEEEDDDEEGSEAELPSDLSDDEEGPDTLEGLDSFVDELDAADRKKRAMKGVKAEVAKTKRRVLPVSSGPQASNGKLDLSTLIASHPSLSGASGLLPSKADNKSSSSILKQGVLPAPLPTVVQDRLDREAAYEKTKEEGQKWSAAMKRIKEAEHLQFPLQSKERGGVKSSGEVIGSFKAQNQFEDAITSLLKSANLTESAVTKRENEELQGQELTMDEIKARREKLAYQRELMFRAESKAKRISKIKSKTYRKLARKRAAREGGGDIDLDDLEKIDPEAAAHEREKLERDRARERATLRHGAKSGRWARDTQGGEAEMEDRRRAREEMLDIKDKLQRKIQGKDEGDSSDSESDDNNDDDDDEDAIREKAFNQLSALDKPVENKGKKGLMDMAFMKKAQDREMRKVAEEEKQARMDIENYGNGSNSDDDSEDEQDQEAIMEKVGGNEGRMVFAPTKPNAQGQTAQPTQPPVQEKPVEATSTKQPFKSSLSAPEPESNPWLTSTISASGPSRKKNSTVATDKASRQLAKSAQAREAVLEDERVDIVDKPVVTQEKGQGKKRKVAEEEEEEEEDGMLPNGLKGFKQRDLVAEAFAGDDVVQDFAAEKARQTEADAPKTQDTSLPGWNSWGGRGTKKSKKNPKYLLKTSGIEPALRKDFTTSNVIITEKKDKKASAFQVKDLPYPYTSVEQYEARFKTPLGSEWNSRGVHQKETMPRVVKKPGAIIEPVRRLF